MRIYDPEHKCTFVFNHISGVDGIKPVPDDMFKFRLITWKAGWIKGHNRKAD